MITFLLANWLWILLGAVAAWISGKAYVKGRTHAKAKADKQLKREVDDYLEELEAARSDRDIEHANRLRDNDGFRRD